MKKEISSDRIVKTFLDYFARHKKPQHKLLQEASLIPYNDPSALFISAGMHPLKPFILGLKEPPSKRLCSIQKCFRTTDIDEVGIKDAKLTFFFMLGNWSLGDYWKKETIEMAYDLVANVFKIPIERLQFSVFKGTKGTRQVAKDKEAIEAWLAQGIQKQQIVELGEDNFWSSGPVGPCGPCSEIYYDTTQQACEKGKNCKAGCECGRWIELWNLVFIQYNKNEQGKLEKLPFNSVDTGAGLERFALVLQNKKSVYETDLFKEIVKTIEAISGMAWQNASPEIKKSMKIIADHIRASCFLIAEGIEPAKVGRGYVLRRLIRRAIRHLRLLKINVNASDIAKIAETVAVKYKNYLAEQQRILQVIETESNKFLTMLNKGLKFFYQIAEKLKQEKKKIITGIDAFHLYDTYGFPLELTKELATEQKLEIDEKDFEKAFEAHKKKSRAGMEAEFKSGLAEICPETIKLHTATHLLHQALRDVLGLHVQQKGSNITKERLRFDFSHDKKLAQDEIKKIEAIVNQKIQECLPVKKEEMGLDEAKKQRALAFFELIAYKHGEKVRVYSIGTYSKEVCAGPHAKNTKELGNFKIVKEEALGTGLRRIKAVLE